MRPKIRNRDLRCLLTFEQNTGKAGRSTRHKMEFIGLKLPEPLLAETTHRFTMIHFGRNGFTASDPIINMNAFAAIGKTRILFKGPPGKKKTWSNGCERMPWICPIRNWDTQHNSTRLARSRTRV